MNHCKISYGCCSTSDTKSEIPTIAQTGPIPVALLRWKFVDGRVINLRHNAGLELPSNIGELGESVTKIDLSEHNLRGERMLHLNPNGVKNDFVCVRRRHHPEVNAKPHEPREALAAR